jgi:polyisoprenoid-binding protein YceI
MMISTVRGAFERYEAEVDADPNQLEAARVIARVETGSINTGVAQRDAHLRSADFFDSEQHPTMVFTTTNIKRNGDELEVAGNLKIRDQEHPVELRGEVVGPYKDPWGNQRLGFSLSGEIDREQWGLKWNQALEAGGMLVAKKVKIEVEAQLVQSS